MQSSSIGFHGTHTLPRPTSAQRSGELPLGDPPGLAPALVLDPPWLSSALLLCSPAEEAGLSG